MALLWMDSFDLNFYERGKWETYALSGNASNLQYLPTEGVLGTGAVFMAFDNWQSQYYKAYMLFNKSYITANFQTKNISMPSISSTLRISFWMKCTPGASSIITRTMPFMLLQSNENYLNNGYALSGMPICLDSNGRISFRDIWQSNEYLYYNSNDFFALNALGINYHARLDDGNWHHIEMSFKKGSNEQIFNIGIHVDGNLYLYRENLYLISSATPVNKIDIVRFMSIPDMNILYDDIVIWSDVNEDYSGFKGPIKIYSTIPTANSSPSDAIPSEGVPADKWTLVGGVPYNNSWTLNQTWVNLSIGGKEFYEMSNVTGDEIIHAVSYTMNYSATYKPITVSPPGIVSSGLVLYLDAGDTNSFPGVGPLTGTTWYDLSGYGKHASFVNTPSYNPSAGAFDLDYFDYFLGSQTYNTPSLPTGSQSRTIIAGFRTPSSNSVGDVLHVFHYGSQSTSQASGIMLIDQFGNNAYYVSHHGWNDNPYITGYPLETSKDYIVAITYDNSASPKFKGFINGGFNVFSADSTLNTTTNFQYFVASRIDGSGFEFLQPSGSSSGARVYFVLVYNRVLTNDEIQQVYDNFKVRIPSLGTITNYANVRPVLVSNGVTYNGTTRSSITNSYTEVNTILTSDFGNSNTNWTANGVNSLIAGFENVG